MALDRWGKKWHPLRSAVDSLREFAYACPLPARYRRPVRVRPRIGLALSGGFAHGLAHLGVLKVLLENQISIDALAGTSVGSVVAAAFASGCRLEVMVEAGRAIRWKTFGRWTVDRLGLATNERMEAMLKSVLRCSKFEELPIPLAIVAADISTGETVTFRHGDLIPPLRASCSFPGLFVPIFYQGHLLVDGAIVASVPVEALRDLGVDRIIAVNLKSSGPQHVPANIFQVIGQAFQIAQGLNQRTWRKSCDVIIEPDVSSFRWDEFGRADELILAGEQAARRMMPAIRALMQPREVSASQSVLAP
ncbi:MAG: patatin-like phospholipase family protein [Terriglobia bacterium]